MSVDLEPIIRGVLNVRRSHILNCPWSSYTTAATPMFCCILLVRTSIVYRYVFTLQFVDCVVCGSLFGRYNDCVLYTLRNKRPVVSLRALPLPQDEPWSSKLDYSSSFAYRSSAHQNKYFEIWLTSKDLVDIQVLNNSRSKFQTRIDPAKATWFDTSMLTAAAAALRH